MSQTPNIGSILAWRLSETKYDSQISEKKAQSTGPMLANNVSPEIDEEKKAEGNLWPYKIVDRSTVHIAFGMDRDSDASLRFTDSAVYET